MEAGAVGGGRKTEDRGWKYDFYFGGVFNSTKYKYSIFSRSIFNLQSPWVCIHELEPSIFRLGLLHYSCIAMGFSPSHSNGMKLGDLQLEINLSNNNWGNLLELKSS
jgi:hypothetical protein